MGASMCNINTGEIILYNSEDGQVKINLHAIDNTVWLSQPEMGQLFDKGRTTITEHIQNIFAEGELNEKVVCREFRHTTQHGAITGKSQTSTTKYYSLDMILAVGFRVRSPRGVQFRKWANSVLQQYLVKGFAMDDDKLKQADNWDYFDEWLQRIRDIRASEKRFYQKVRDLYATAIDYAPKSPQAQEFFAKVQNKMLWAVTGNTAPEIIAHRSNAEYPNMGLTAWSGAVVRKKDVSIAKNYLSQDEVKTLNQIVTMYLDYAELQASQRQTMTMNQWAEKLDAFLTFNEQDILTHAGTIQSTVAKKLAEQEYQNFDQHRKHQQVIKADDTDIQEIENMIKQIKGNKK